MIFLNTAMQEGVIILVVGLLIVFTSLLLLFVVFQFLAPFILKTTIKRKGRKNGEGVESSGPKYDSGEEMAAAAAAIYLFLEDAHDEENTIITIDKASKNYSPWSSKIYVTHNLHHR
ncbi:MAG TPA: hypothetical protein DDY13_07460 [Cytophagales bacterium]|jgi:Na+-transporting methylmalonyl-CoA/oxaloacetate decarboxylase gamma subunit|nr:hypothetical protein [Cytophagales bacterium]